MTPLASSAASAVRHQVSTRIGFFIIGFAMSAWAPLVPFAKARLGLDDGEMGVMLLCLGAGSFVTMPLAGAAAARFGCRAVIAAMVAVMAAGLPLLASLQSVPAFACALVVFGAGLGALDVTINIQAIIVERDSGRSMMSGFHGLFSLGGIGGALAVSGLLGAGMEPLGAVLLVVAVVVMAEVAAFRGQLPYGGRSDGPAFALPRGVVLFLGVLCCIVFLTEGAILDWSALFLSGAGFLETSQAGLGYAAFSCTMTLCRLFGDGVVGRLGPKALVTGGGLTAALGLGLATQAPWAWASLSGFALVGIGCANIVPVLFTAAGRQREMPEALAVPAITTMGYAGILAGPAAIGLVAQHTSLATGLLVVAVLLVGVAASGRWVSR
jgi:MFS family permease